jgi:hypothetical protein
MHNIDRTQLEAELYELSPEFLESEFTQEAGFPGETPHQESPLFETPFHEAQLQEAEYHEASMTEAEEMELAAELLEITTEEELDQFIGRLFRRIGRGIGRIIRSPVGRALGGLLRGVAKRVLPIAGTALGGMVGGPVGAAIGGRLAGAAGRVFGLELEGLSPEDREFEVARRFVRFAGNAAHTAALSPPTIDPTRAARAAVAASARRFAPGLLGRVPPTYPSPLIPPSVAGVSGRSGRWVRRGNRIILFGA